MNSVVCRQVAASWGMYCCW